MVKNGLRPRSEDKATQASFSKCHSHFHYFHSDTRVSVLCVSENSMGNQVVDNKFTWIIKNFSSLPTDDGCFYSDEFVIGGCKWCLFVFTDGLDGTGYFDPFLEITFKSLPLNWRGRVRFKLTIVNQNLEKSVTRDRHKWFDGGSVSWSVLGLLPLTELYAKDGGFLVNDEVKIIVEVDVLEVTGEEDVSQRETQPLKKIKLENGLSCELPKDFSWLKESINVNGFHVLPSQVESVRRLFDKHPDIALDFHPKNQLLRTACMNVLLSLIGTLRQSLQELAYGDLVGTDSALAYLKDSGFKVDWLEKKLEEVKAKKKEEQICEIRVQELEKELKDFKKKQLDIEAQLEKEKAKLVATRAHLTSDDFF